MMVPIYIPNSAWVSFSLPGSLQEEHMELDDQLVSKPDLKEKHMGFTMMSEKQNISNAYLVYKGQN